MIELQLADDVDPLYNVCNTCIEIRPHQLTLIRKSLGVLITHENSLLQIQLLEIVCLSQSICVILAFELFVTIDNHPIHKPGVFLPVVYND